MGRFFRVTPTPIQSQFVEAPLDFMYQSLQGKQQELDTAKTYETALRGLLDVEVDPRYDVPTLLEKQKQYEGLIDEYATQLERTGNVNQALTNVQDIQRQITKDRFLQEAPENWKKIQKDIEEYNKALATNKVSDYNKRFQDYYFSGNKWKGTQGDEGTNLYTPGSLYYENQDHHKKANEIMGSINYDGYDWSTANFEGGAFKISKKGGKDYIDSNKVLKLASDKSETFLNSTEGQDWVRKVIYDQTGSMVDDANWNKFDKETQDFLKQSATDYLYKAAEEQIFARTKTGSDIDFNKGLDDKIKEERIAIMSTGNIPIQNLGFVKGRVKRLKDSLLSFVFGNTGELEGYNIEKYVETDENGNITNVKLAELPTNIKNYYYNVINNLSSTSSSDFVNLSDQDKLNTIISAYNNFTELGMTENKYTMPIQQVQTERLFDDLHTRTFVDLETGKTMKWSDVSSKLGYNKLSKDELKKLGSVTGEIHGLPNENGNVGSWYGMEIVDKESGKTKKFAFTADNEVSQNYSGYNNLQYNLLQGNFKYFNDATNNGDVETINLYRKDGSTTPLTFMPIMQINNGVMDGGGVAAYKQGGTTYVIDKNGNSIPYPKDEKARQNLLKSGNLQYYNKDQMKQLIEESSQNDNIRYTGSGNQLGPLNNLGY